jgi:hypothetical protein
MGKLHKARWTPAKVLRQGAWSTVRREKTMSPTTSVGPATCMLSAKFKLLIFFSPFIYLHVYTLFVPPPPQMPPKLLILVYKAHRTDLVLLASCEYLCLSLSSPALPHHIVQCPFCLECSASALSPGIPRFSQESLSPRSLP